jgi:hypothetical protein
MIASFPILSNLGVTSHDTITPHIILITDRVFKLIRDDCDCPQLPVGRCVNNVLHVWKDKMKSRSHPSDYFDSSWPASLTDNVDVYIRDECDEIKLRINNRESEISYNKSKINCNNR